MRVMSPVSKPYSSNTRSDGALGILVCERDGNPPFAESSFIKRLSLIGANSGLRLFAFSPWTWNSGNDSVKGWSWNNQKLQWEASQKKLPSIVYDRSWPETQEEKQRYRQALRQLCSARRLIFLNGRLPHKGKVYEILSKDLTFKSIIPPTARYQGPISLSSWLRKHRHAAFLKPIAGSQGKRVIAVIRIEYGKIKLTGRHEDNRLLNRNCENEADALRRIDRWIGTREYLMQPMLDLTGNSGEPFDLRALMQKNGAGRWVLTGIAARQGAPGSVTANLHGGGTAAPAEKVLTLQFGEQRGSELLQEMKRLSFLIVARLEQSFGRFAEIGLDYGVDQSGRPWFLEANSKPGRAAMGSAGKEAAYASAEQPLSYARSILLRLATTDARLSPLGNGCSFATTDTQRSPLGNGCSFATTDTQRSPLGNGCASPGRVIHEFDHL
ncbi:YheC/YheD family protein [Cohnella luojiensis]|uniref:YheC/YheD family protein n=1 Tax=Cohnella luojiensis TaxID=652876 RepID=A0A4Y8M5A3_9BACL|nr:YheC/YheD family protein [Cohnella luojiensis]TFE30652.1 YheC/YheD family protein [Cohnella luojiensis]